MALITEIGGSPASGNFSCHALGREVLRFSTQVVQLSREDAASWVGARNLVASTLLMAMGGPLSRQEKLQRMIEFFQIEASEEETALLFPLLPEVGRLTHEEHAMTIKYLTQLPKPKFMVMMEEQATSEGLAKGMAQGIEEGLRRKALEDAHRMREHGIAWEIVTDVTGLRPEDLKEN